MKLPRPSAAESARALADTAVSTAILKATPKRDDVVAALGADSLSRKDGKWKIKVMDPSRSREDNLKRFRTVNDMMAKRWRLESERSKNIGESLETVRMQGPQGDLRDMPAAAAVAAERKGFAYRPRLRGRTVLREIRGTLYRCLADGSLVLA